MFTAIFKSVIGAFTGELFDRVKDVFGMYFNKQITEAQLREKLQECLLSSAVAVEKNYGDSIAQTYGAFINAAKDNPTMARAWAWVCYSMLGVLLWHMMAIPLITLVVRVWHPGWTYPSSGSTVDWAYALLAFCIGGGLAALRGPTSNPLDKLKSLVGGK